MLIKAYFTYQMNSMSSGWSVNQFTLQDPGETGFLSGERITIVGDNVPTYQDVLYEIEGDVKTHQKYGKRFHLISWKECIKEEKNSIISYLSSGMINGIGKILAGRIYEKFGNDTIKILDNEPDKLLQVRGISRSTLDKIMDSYVKTHGARDIILLLSPFGISSKIIMKCYQLLGADAVNVIKENPYCIASVEGITFSTCDRIAEKIGFPKDHPERIRAGFNEMLKKNETSGHSCIFCEDLGTEVVKFLKLPGDVVSRVFSDMLLNKEIMVTNKFVYRKNTYYAECELAKELVRIASSSTWYINFDIEEEINLAEQELGIKLHTNQRMGVKEALLRPLVVITGGPGTGKTSMLNVLTHVVDKMFPDKTIMLMAPTGRASRRMSESTGRDACTIHHALGLMGDDEKKALTSDTVLGSDFVDADEVSMLDMWVALALVRAIPNGTKLVMVGDVDQLPSVGAGNVLHDLIMSGLCHVVKLEHVFRQAEGSTIDLNCKKMINDNSELIWDETFQLHEVPDAKGDMESSFDAMAAEMERIYKKEVDKYGIENVILLCPFRKRGAASAHQMNIRMQKLMNSKGAANELVHGSYSFRIGDAVMHLKNEEDVCNGDIGFVVDICNCTDEQVVIVKYFDANEKKYFEKKYVGDEIDSLELAYAMTVHKAQGSEYKSVIFCLNDEHCKMKIRNIVYTAASRAKQVFHFVGSQSALREAIHHPYDQRNTMLAQRISYYYKRYMLTGILD